MIPYGLLSQISLIIVAVALTLTYVKPMFVKISDVQDKIALYQEEKDKVSAVNQKLATLVQQVNAVSLEDQKRLLTYMPNSVDTIAVPRDIEAIAAEAGVLVRSITYGGPIAIPVADGQVTSSTPEPHAFLIEFESSYEQLKAVLTSFEQNHYPLEVSEMEVRKLEGGFIGSSVKIITYDRTLPVVEAQPALQ